MAAKKNAGDISKQVYKFQEGITAVALEVAGFPVEEVHWPTNKRPTGLTVDVDVLVGPTPEEATHNLSVKHMGSGKESEKGSWRMMREILDSKANGPRGSGIYNVYFDSAAKENWGKILAAFFDGYLVLPDHPKFGPILIRKAYEYAKGSLKGVQDQMARQILRDAITAGNKTYDRELAAAVGLYARTLASMLKKQAAGLDSFWKIVRASCNREIPKIEPRVTSFKRGLAKLLILEPEDRQKVYAWFRGGKEINSLPKYAIDLGLADEGVVDTEIIDPDIIRLFGILPKNAGEFCEEICSDSPVSRMMENYIIPLRELSNVKAFNQYIIDHYQRLCTKQGMTMALRNCFENPMGLLEGYATCGEDKSVWLFSTLMALFKASGGTRQTSGLTALVNASGIDPLKARFDIPSFVYREKSLDSIFLGQVALGLAKMLKEIDQDSLESLIEEVPDYYRQRLLEAQLIPYRDFDPIGIVLKKALTEQGIAFVHHSSFATCAREFAGTSGGGTTKVLEIRGKVPSMIMWQSPNKNSRDKAKEFAARCACLKAKYEAKKGNFAERGVRVFMIIDGIWDQNDIDSLLRFGCEHVYYPDEIDHLVTSIVGKTAKKIITMTPAEDLPQAAESDIQPNLKRRGNRK